MPSVKPKPRSVPKLVFASSSRFTWSASMDPPHPPSNHQPFSFDAYTSPPVLAPAHYPEGGTDILNARVSYTKKSSPIQPGIPDTHTPPLDINARDDLLHHAYRMYEGSPGYVPSGLTHRPLSQAATMVPPTAEEIYKEQVSLLTIINSLHGHHPPTLLLLGCVYHAMGHYESALRTFREILLVEPNYPEAISNIGVTLHALGQLEEARSSWERALQINPVYWDAMDHLIASFLGPNSPSASTADNIPDYLHAHALCRSMLSRLDHSSDGQDLILQVPSQQLYQLQKLYCTSAALVRFIPPVQGQYALDDYYKAIELAINPPGVTRFTFRDLVGAVGLASLCIAYDGRVIPQRIVDALSTQDLTYTSEIITAPDFDVLQAAHVGGSRLLRFIYGDDDFVKVAALLLPEQALRLAQAVFSKTGGVLPGICSFETDSSLLSMPQKDVQQPNDHMTSSILSILALYIQELPPDTPLLGSNVRTGSTVALALLFLSLAIVPAAPTYNNIGIILKSLSYWRTCVLPNGEREVLTGHVLARTYYNQGLHKSSHRDPFLLANWASLLKEEGHISEAIRFYQSALHYKEDFDIALVNYGGTLKDSGRLWEAVQFFERAIAINPYLPEAICGYSSAKTALSDWRGRGTVGDELGVDENGLPVPAQMQPSAHGQPGWLRSATEITARQIKESYAVNIGLVKSMGDVQFWLSWVEKAVSHPLSADELTRWRKLFRRFFQNHDREEKALNECGFVIRFVEWSTRCLQRNWYRDLYGYAVSSDTPHRSHTPDDIQRYTTLRLPLSSIPPPTPSVLPFHTFAYPMTPRMIRLISHRNALRVSYSVLTQPWVPSYVYPPPAPPVQGKINIGYVSSDFRDHPLAHLMQSVFGLHDRHLFCVYVYSLGTSDGSPSRQKIEADSEHFIDCSSWSTKLIVERIVNDHIHILVNLGGYTKNARNDIFALRPCPIQISLMGFSGTLAAGWCDYLVCDPIACPRELAASERWRTRRKRQEETSRMQDSFKELDLETDLESIADPESLSDAWMYTEKLIYMPGTFMVTDHKQSSRGDENLTVCQRAETPSYILWADEEKRRYEWRRQLFPALRPDTVVFANYNQLYKICPTIFNTWLTILARVSNSVLWLLKFPAVGEENILNTARLWAGEEIASRILFTDVVPKHEHIERTRAADLVLDTIECSAHTIAADTLWSGTPILACRWPRYKHKMCSRVAASMAFATGFGEKMVVESQDEYKERAVALAQGLSYSPVETQPGVPVWRAQGELATLRRDLFLNRDIMPLFDTERWTRNLERGYREVWRRWALGTDFENSREWEKCEGPEKDSGCIFIDDVKDEPIQQRPFSKSASM